MKVEEITKDEREFEQELNDLYGTVTICGMTFDQGTALKELDPIAFRCSLADQDIRYQCGECNETFDDESDAKECCQVDCSGCFEKFDTQAEADKCAEKDNEEAEKESKK